MTLFAASAQPVSAGTRFVAFVGHDTNLEEFAGMLKLSWLMPGYPLDDTPPGGALVFELRRGQPEPLVRVFFAAQSLDAMRNLSPEAPARVPVFIPGCPVLDCPVNAFDRGAGTTIDPAFVGPLVTVCGQQLVAVSLLAALL